MTFKRKIHKERLTLQSLHEVITQDSFWITTSQPEARSDAKERKVNTLKLAEKKELQFWVPDHTVELMSRPNLLPLSLLYKVIYFEFGFIKTEMLDSFAKVLGTVLHHAFNCFSSLRYFISHITRRSVEYSTVKYMEKETIFS